MATSISEVKIRNAAWVKRSETRVSFHSTQATCSIDGAPG